MGTEVWQLADSPPVADWRKAGAIIVSLPGVSVPTGLSDPLPIDPQPVRTTLPK